MKKRLIYEAPETELFVVRFEENILSDKTPVRGSAGDFEGGIEGASYDLD